MKLLMFSDSHGNEQAMRRAMEAHPDATGVVFLGDGAAEALRLSAEDDPRPWHIVSGNCDVDRRLVRRDVISFGGHRIYITHGHAEHVKSDLLRLSFAALEQDCEAAFYGHTHIPDTTFYNGVQLFNPGSIGQSGAYGTAEIRGGVLYTTHHRL